MEKHRPGVMAKALNGDMEYRHRTMGRVRWRSWSTPETFLGLKKMYLVAPCTAALEITWT